MKRMKSFGSVLVILLILFKMPLDACAVRFADEDEIRYNIAVAAVTDLKIMSGTGDGANFDPQGTVSRGEMCRMIVLILNGGKDPVLAQVTEELPFADIQENTFCSYIVYCYNLGVVSGRGDGTFDPESAVTLTQASKMLLAAIGYDGNVERFTGPDWAINAIVRANQKDFFAGVDQDPSLPISRDCAAQLIYNAIHAVMVKYDIVLTTANGELQGVPMLRDMEDGESMLSRYFKISE